MALFANPYANGREEMLYVDPDGDVRWVRHVNAEGDDTGPGGLEGWTEDVAIPGLVRQVAVAVHPDGSVWAFVVKPSPDNLEWDHLYGYQLQPSADVAGGLGWAEGYTDTAHGHFFLSPVFYCSDRPATPAIIVENRGSATVTVLVWLPTRRPDTAGMGGAPWRRAGSAEVHPDDIDSPRVVVIDSPNTVWQDPVVEVIRIWSVTNGHLVVEERYPRLPSDGRYVAGDFPDTMKLLGAWTYPGGSGVVASTVGAGGRTSISTYFQLPAGDQFERWDSESTLVPLDDLVVWQDDNLLMHVYGRDPLGTMQVAHQQGWAHLPVDFPGSARPLWETGKEGNLLTRPLLTGVATFLPDPYPATLLDGALRRLIAPSGHNAMALGLR